MCKSDASRTPGGLERDLGELQVHRSAVYSVPWVDFIDRDVQTCSDVLDSLVAFGDDSHTLSDGLSCDWMITCYHDDLVEGTFVFVSAMNRTESQPRQMFLL